MVGDASDTDSLVVESTDRYPSTTFKDFFDEYDRAFILPAEKEDEAGFAACLRLNHGPDHATLVERFGPFREIVMVMRTEPDGPVVGGANFLVTRIDRKVGSVVTVNLNYAFTTAGMRRRGLLRPLLARVRRLASQLEFAGAGEPLIFIEQNDPFRMTAESYRKDSAHAGTDQFDRLVIWSRVGARVLDFDYVQPALSSGKSADDTLVYAILSPDTHLFDPLILADHLERFFSISVFKGAPLTGEALSQLNYLRGSNEQLRAFNALPLLERIVARRDRFSYFAQRPTSLRKAIAMEPQLDD